MRRFITDPADVTQNSIIIRGEEASHIKNVVRLRAGDDFIAVDGTGFDYVCRITDIGSAISADILRREQNKAEPGIRVTLYQAYPKLAKMNEIVQKAVELGAAEIVPFLSKRCVKRPAGQGDKLARVAREAVKQCGRGVFPAVSDVLEFGEALEMMRRHEQLIVCWEEERAFSLKQALAGGAKNIGVVIGPEGGFAPEEVEKMRDIGGVSVSLGPRILRTETAGIAVLAALFYEKGQMQY